MIIRKIELADLAAVADILAASPEAAQWAREDLADPGWPNTGTWVADERGRVIGFVAARTAADEAEILNLAVAPEWRCRGAGRMLVDAAMAAAQAAGAARVYLEVRASNAPARKFYARLGFAESGRRRNYYRDPAEDALVLARNLSSSIA